MTPARLLVDRRHREVAQRPDHGAGRGSDGRRDLSARRLVHEGHELVREAGHRAADADAANVGASADAAHPAALGHVAFDDRTPAAQLHETLRRIVFGRELALLVVAAAVASFVNGGAEEPRGPARFVERNHRRAAGGLPEQIQDRLGEVVGLNRASRDANDRQPGARLPIPAEIIENAHRPGGIAGHRVDAAVRRAGPGGQYRPRFRGEAIDPTAEGDRLIASRRVAESREVAFFVDLFVGDRSLEHQYERIELPALGREKGLKKFGAAETIFDQRPMKFDSG